MKCKRSETSLHITVQQISSVNEPTQSDAIYSLHFCAYVMRTHERLQKLTLDHTISNRLSIQNKKSAKVELKASYQVALLKLKTERNWFMKSAGVWRTSLHAAFSRSQKVFSLLRTHPKQDPKKFQLDVILLCEEYQKQTQVSGHITWKLLS